jgi:predicted nucleotidyltransferase
MDILAEWAADAPVTVYLFGSRARGDHRPDTDVDLYIQYQDTKRKPATNGTTGK